MSEKNYNLTKLRQAFGAGAASAKTRGSSARYALVLDENGNLYNCGELKSLADGVAEIAISDTFMFHLGLFQLTGEVVRFPEDRVLLFEDKEPMLQKAAELYLLQTKQ